MLCDVNSIVQVFPISKQSDKTVVDSAYIRNGIFLIGFSFRILQLKKAILKKVSDQSTTRRTQTEAAEEDNFEFVCSKNALCYIHERSLIWDM